MLKRHKDLLRAIVAPLRTTLAGTAQADGAWQRGDLDRELERLGVAPDSTITPLDALPNASPTERRARYAAEVAITTAVNGAKGTEADRRRTAAREEVIERAAYTWINRLLALRAIEARGLIDETLRNNPEYNGVSEALFILRSDAPARTAGTDGGWWAVIEDACKQQVEALPGLFDLSDPVAALRPSTSALLRCVGLVGTAPSGYTLEEADAAFADPDAIGWAYQFYQEAAKARVYAKLGSGGKAASRAEIAAATQLFTEPYMVQWLLQNSLGRSYHEAYPDSTLPETWAYYIRQRPEGQQAPDSPRPLHALDLIDPCCGSGHFLREAFDMFAAMYRERHPELSAAEIADRILTRHLHGIDLDPRAAQLTALTLYLRAWEYVKDEGGKTKDGRRQLGTSSVVYRPSSLNIATTPSGLSAGALQRHLRRHPEDRVMKPLLEGVFAALEQADILGSLLRPAEHIDTAIKALQQPHTMQMDFDADDAALRRTVTALANSDPPELKRMLLDRVAQSFHAEAGDADDVAVQLFGREAEGGVRLLQLLDRKYAVVVTNPPYMGSRYMNTDLKRYTEHYYRAGKRDIYAAIIMKCLDLSRPMGRLAMITQHNWMFMSSFLELRAAKSEIPSKDSMIGQFPGLLNNSRIELLVHLGSNSFEEISGEVVQNVMFAISNILVHDNDTITALRLVGFPNSTEKASVLCDKISKKKNITYSVLQKDMLAFPQSAIVYWADERVFGLFKEDNTLSRIADTKKGVATLNNDKFLRFSWEVPDNTVWMRLAKAGTFSRWCSEITRRIDWQHEGARVKAYVSYLYKGAHWSKEVRSPEYYFRDGLCYSIMSPGSLDIRRLSNEIFEIMSGSIFSDYRDDLISILNTNVVSYILRLLSGGTKLNIGALDQLPLPKNITGFVDGTIYKSSLIRKSLISDIFNHSYNIIDFSDAAISLMLVCAESYNNKLAIERYALIPLEKVILAETGTPAGFHPLISGYDVLPDLPIDLDLLSLPQEVLDYLAAHERSVPSPAELQRIKARLRGLYEAGPGVKENEESAETADAAGGGDDEGEAAVSGTHIPIPTETFLEELSVKMQIHPISVYWLLEELRGDGARCKPEEQRLLEDRLSVIVLRLLGHRWPKQLEAGEQVPSWADADGIIPISGGTGEQTLAERVRARLRAEDGDLGAQRAEALLNELTGLSLEDWLRREFFKRHGRQFKYRPIAWQLASDPSVAVADAKAKKRVGGRRAPAFECLVYYHACGGDVLARIRTQYVEPLLRGARQQLEQASHTKDEDGVVQANMRIQELADFNRRLQQVAERGFASPELDKLCENEPLDRWSYDGYLSPISREDFLRHEQAWRVDLNDGVRVNIAPVQLAGLLLSDVLKAVDAKKAIADRARWRSDERRWVRTGKLPRCGWMPESVPESAEWTRLAPQREAERVRLEEKRRAVVERREDPA